MPVAELEDTLTEMVGDAGFAALTTTPPLQAFSERNFVAGRLGVAGPWSFDPMHLDAARALQTEPPDDSGLEREWAPGDIVDHLRLDDLIAFVQSVKACFVKRIVHDGFEEHTVTFCDLNPEIFSPPS